MENKNNSLYGEKMKNLPEVGQNVEGVVIRNERNTLYIDLAPFGTGIIFGREYLIIKDLVKDIFTRNRSNSESCWCWGWKWVHRAFSKRSKRSRSLGWGWQKYER